MQPKLLKTPHGEFDPVIWNGTNESGIEPINDRVVVMPDQAAGQSSGGVFLPDDLKERMDMASETGVIVAIGSEAFLFTASGRRWEGEKPQIGWRVWYERYAGSFHRGVDGRHYRIMDDRCVGARVGIVTAAVAENEAA